MQGAEVKTIDVELSVVRFFNPRINLIVPNVWWAFFNHECDLIVVTKSGYAYEVEIKVSKSDLIADKKKRWGHYDRENRIKGLYFAIPDRLYESCLEHIPTRAGIITVSEKGQVRIERKPEMNKSAKQWPEKDRYHLARLGSMRIWGLKRKLQEGQGVLPL
jgi:hypothetical protein